MKFKSKHFVIPAVALAAAVTLTPVYADDHEVDGTDRASDRAFDRNSDRASDRRRGSLRKKVNRIFNALDTNEDEVITLDEMLAKPLAKAEGKFDRIDTDDDGLISLEEFLAVGDDREPPTDVDRDEVRACVADRLGTDVPERPDRETRIAELDQNGDGFIDFDEFVFGLEQKVETRFNNVDADGDGGITKAELFEALKGKRDVRRARRDCVEDQRETDELIG